MRSIAAFLETQRHREMRGEKTNGHNSAKVMYNPANIGEPVEFTRLPIQAVNKWIATMPAGYDAGSFA